MVTGRVGLAAAVLAGAVRASGQRFPRGWGLWGAFFVMGALNNVIPFGLIFWGQTRIPSGLAAILNATTPLFTVLFAHVLTADERLTARRVAGTLLGLLGVVVILGPAALAGLGGELGEAAVLGAAVSYALAGIFGRRFRGVPPLVTAWGQLTAASVMALPLALTIDRPWLLPAPSASAIAALVALAVISTALAYVIYFRILATAGATNLLLVTILIPVSALFLGALILGESVGSRQIAGLALIGLGLAAIDGRPFARLGAVLSRIALRRVER
jgi:drug/metabolite transporter (DMT)-like permease